MADFCFQCWGTEEYTDDFVGLSTAEDSMNGLFSVVLCEGCGPTQVNHDGVCIAFDCLEHHGLNIPDYLR